MAASFAKLKETFVFNFIEGARWKYITNGLWVTLEVTFFALLLGIVIGVVVAMIRSSYDQMKEEMKPGVSSTLTLRPAKLIGATEREMEIWRLISSAS